MNLPDKWQKIIDEMVIMKGFPLIFNKKKFAKNIQTKRERERGDLCNIREIISPFLSLKEVTEWHAAWKYATFCHKFTVVFCLFLFFPPAQNKYFNAVSIYFS